MWFLFWFSGLKSTLCVCDYHLHNKRPQCCSFLLKHICSRPGIEFPRNKGHWEHTGVTTLKGQFHQNKNSLIFSANDFRNCAPWAASKLSPDFTCKSHRCCFRPLPSVCPVTEDTGSAEIRHTQHTAVDSPNIHLLQRLNMNYYIIPLINHNIKFDI